MLPNESCGSNRRREYRVQTGANARHFRVRRHPQGHSTRRGRNGTPSLNLRRKDEEALRDFLLMALSPNFDSASGETFNKKGKTDILIRHKNTNVFVAECSIWAGEKKYRDKLNQALSYLTWRDSKAAVVLFNRNKNLQPVLDTIQKATPEHSCWTHTDAPVGEADYRYRMHLPDDDTRGLQMAVMCFHIPPVAD